MGLGSFGSTAVVNCGQEPDGLIHVPRVPGSILLCSIMLRDLCTVVMLWLLLWLRLGSMRQGGGRGAIMLIRVSPNQ